MKKITMAILASTVLLCCSYTTVKNDSVLKSENVVQKYQNINAVSFFLESILNINYQAEPRIAHKNPEGNILSNAILNPSKMAEEVENNHYSILETSDMLLKDEWFADTNSIKEYADKIIELSKMQKLASYISVTYKLPLPQAEEIVYIAFVEAKKRDIEPLLLLSLIGVESTYQQYVTSGVGAVGLTQVMPVFHKEKILELTKENLDIWSVQGNIKLGSQIIQEYIEISDGNLENALQRYNGSLHDKNKKYSNKVLDRMNALNKIYYS